MGIMYVSHIYEPVPPAFVANQTSEPTVVTTVKKADFTFTLRRMTMGNFDHESRLILSEA